MTNDYRAIHPSVHSRILACEGPVVALRKGYSTIHVVYDPVRPANAVDFYSGSCVALILHRHQAP